MRAAGLILLASSAQAIAGDGDQPLTDCRAQIEARVAPGSHDAGLRRDRLEITTYGPGRRAMLQLPGVEELDLCLVGCGKKKDERLAADDYTERAQFADAGPVGLAPGEYWAEILPPDRQAMLLPDEHGTDTGRAGAIVLVRKNASDGEAPIVIHSGPATTAVLGRTPALLMTRDELDRLMGGLVSARHMGWSLDWRSAVASIPSDAACRAANFEPFPVYVTQAPVPGVSQYFGRKFGGRVPLVEGNASAGLATAVSLDDIERAQITGGMTVLQFIDRIEDLLPKLDAKVLDRVLRDPSLTDAQRREKLLALNEQAQATVSEAIVLLEGVRLSLKDPDFTSYPRAWESVLTDFERRTSRLVTKLDNEVAPILPNGDKGNRVESLWLAAADKPLDAKTCDLSPVEVQVDPLPFELPGVKRPVPLNLGGLGRVWFSPVLGSPGQYRANVSVRINMEPTRAAHRDMWQQVVTHSLDHTCNVRHALRETDQAVSQDGTMRLKANVRQEQWWCGWYKYPCGASLGGITTCRQDVKTRLVSITQGIRQTARAVADGQELGVQFTSTGEPVAFTKTIESIPLLRTISATAYLIADEGKFVSFNGAMWGAFELKGQQVMYESVACAIANNARSQ